ncbi:MAG: hypothetical protein WCP85_10575 [Mariniphaga sp.]
MNIFDQLGEIYTEIDNSYTTIELISHSHGHFKKESEYEQSFFVDTKRWKKFQLDQAIL